MILKYHFGFPLASDELHVVEPTYDTVPKSVSER